MVTVYQQRSVGGLNQEHPCQVGWIMVKRLFDNAGKLNPPRGEGGREIGILTHTSNPKKILFTILQTKQKKLRPHFRPTDLEPLNSEMFEPQILQERAIPISRLIRFNTHSFPARVWPKTIVLRRQIPTQSKLGGTLRELKPF